MNALLFALLALAIAPDTTTAQPGSASQTPAAASQTPRRAASDRRFAIPLKVGPAGLDPSTPGFLGIGVWPIGTATTLPRGTNVAVDWIGQIHYLAADGVSEVGMAVVSVDRGSAAERLGIHVGDWVQAVDGNFVGSFMDLISRLHDCWEYGYGTADIRIRRGNEIVSISTEPLRGEREVYPDTVAATPTVKSAVQPVVRPSASAHVLADTIGGRDDMLPIYMLVTVVVMLACGYWVWRAYQ